VIIITKFDCIFSSGLKLFLFSTFLREKVSTIFDATFKKVRNVLQCMTFSHTECVTDLNEWTKMIIFKSILTTFKSSVFLDAAMAVV